MPAATYDCVVTAAAGAAQGSPERAADAPRGRVYTVPFPLPPYPQQRALIAAMRTAIDVGCGTVCVLESPTGTGKTQSLLAAALSWLVEQHATQPDTASGADAAAIMRVLQRRATRTQQLTGDDAAPGVGAKRDRMALAAATCGAAPDGAGEELIGPPAERSGGLQSTLSDSDSSSSDDSFAARRRTSAVTNAPQDSGSDSEGAQLWRDMRTPSPRVIYTSRTHSQLAQVAAEMRGTAFMAGTWPPAAPSRDGGQGDGGSSNEGGEALRFVQVASRGQLCINESVKAAARGSNERLTELCDGARGAANAAKQRSAQQRRVEKRRRRDGVVETRDMEDLAAARAAASGDGSGCAACPYYDKRRIAQLAERMLLKSRTPSELATVGKSLAACPFYATRVAAPYAHVVLMPYSYMIDPRGRRAALSNAEDGAGGDERDVAALDGVAALGDDVDLSNDLVVYDEAHNVAGAVTAAQSAQASVPALRETIAVVNAYVDAYNTRLHVRTKDTLRTLSRALASVAGYAEAVAARASTSTGVGGSNNGGTAALLEHQRLASFAFDANVDNINFIPLVQFLVDTGAARKLRGFAERLAASTPPTQPGAVPQQQQQLRPMNIYAAVALCEQLAFADDDVALAAILRDEAGDVAVSVFAVAPGEAMVKLTRRTRCTVLAGGTMQPFDLLIRQLLPGYTQTHAARLAATREGSDADAPHVVVESYAHVVPADNYVVHTLGVGPSGQQLKFTHARKSDFAAMLRATGAALASLCRVVPDGIVVFFTSYDAERAFFTEAEDAVAEIRRVKRVFREEPNVPSDTLLEAYAAAVVEAAAARASAENPASPVGRLPPAASPPTLRGALLTAVMGGRLSEGINFADRLGRCVVVVGLPYPNPSDPKLQLTMHHLKATGDATLERRYYEALCMRSVNQSIGRCLRHARDHAAIVLVDDRYSTPVVRQQLPKWIDPARVRRCSGMFGDTLRGVREFFAGIRARAAAAQEAAT